MARLLLPLLAIIVTLLAASKATAQKVSTHLVLSLSVPVSVSLFPSLAFANDDPEEHEEDDEEEDDEDEDDEEDDEDEDDYEDDDDFEHDDEDDLETAAEL